MPVFVVDAYTRRIFSRHGYVPTEGDYDELRCFFEDVLEPDAVFFNEFHAQLCRLGAEICRPKPLCESCPARDVLGRPLQ
jgi:endonuclease-3 related protein